MKSVEYIKQPLLIDGKRCEPVSGEYLPVVNPATGRVVGEVASANEVDVDRAVKAAKEAYDKPGWRQMHPRDRADVLVKLAEAISANIFELGSYDALTSGSSMTTLLKFDLAAGAYLALNFANKLPDYPMVEYPPARPLPEAFHLKVLKEPMGVCALITAWNAPIATFLLKAIPALAAGNTIVAKPAQNTSFSTFRLIELMQPFLPPGVINIVTGRGAEVGDALTGHPLVAKISFTGSTATGRHIQQRAAGTLKRVTLELGGKGPALVLPDADLDLTARGVTHAFLLHSGQACISGTRLIVHESLHDALIERCVQIVRGLRHGDPFEDAPNLKPMASEAHMNRVLNYIETGCRDGAKLVTGGKRAIVKGFEGGFFIEPTIFTNVSSDMKIAREEIFGPVLTVIKYRDVEEAIESANDSIYGLAGGIWTGDPEKAYPLASRLQCGTIWINDWHVLTLDTPFGGLRQSGYGKELSLDSLEDFLQTKSIIVSFERRSEFKMAQYAVHGPVSA